MKTNKRICLYSEGWKLGKTFEVDEEIPNSFFFDADLKIPYTDKQVDIEDIIDDNIEEEIAAEKDKQAALELENLRMQYLNTFGKNPHHRAGIEKLKEALANAGKYDYHSESP